MCPGCKDRVVPFTYNVFCVGCGLFARAGWPSVSLYGTAIAVWYVDVVVPRPGGVRK